MASVASKYSVVRFKPHAIFGRQGVGATARALPQQQLYCASYLTYTCHPTAVVQHVSSSLADERLGSAMLRTNNDNSRTPPSPPGRTEHAALIQIRPRANLRL